MGRYVYMRPSADVSLTHSCSSEGSSGYAMIDEEGESDISTYIYMSIGQSSSNTLTSTFKITGNIPNLTHGQIVYGQLRIVGRGSSGNLNSASATVSYEGQSYSVSYDDTDWTIQDFDIPITGVACGQVFNKQVTITTTGQTSSKGSALVQITQVYIVFYYDAQYTITTAERGHGGSVVTPITVPWEEWDGPRITLSENRHIRRLIMDSTSDVTDRVRWCKISGTYKISNVAGAKYAFTYDGSKYYVSTNKGQSNSAALCRVDFHCDVPCTANIYVINYAEATYDYGILGNTDEELSTTYSKDSNYYWIGNTSDKNIPTEQLVSYNLSVGDDYIHIKYRKDGATSSNNDTLQFRIEMVPQVEQGYWGYVIEGVDNDHAFEVWYEIPYVKLNNSWVEPRKIYKKINNFWVEQIDWDNIWDQNKFYTHEIT